MKRSKARSNFARSRTPPGGSEAGQGVPSVRLPRPALRPVGAAPGIDFRDLAARPPLPAVGGASGIRVVCTDFCGERVATQEIEELRGFLDAHRPAWSRVRWIDVCAQNRSEVVRPFMVKYQLHPLAVEDVVHGAHRAKVEDYRGSDEEPGRLFIIARLVYLREDVLQDEQVNIFLGRNTLLTFREAPNAVFDSINRRIQSPGTRIRENDASFLCYSVIDAIVDSYFPVLEQFSRRIEETEEELLGQPTDQVLPRIHEIKRGLLLLRRSIWPMRETIAQLQRERHVGLSDTTLTYFRDVYDHCIQIMDLNETYHEVAVALTETYMSVSSNRLNEILKVLTIISTIFIPLTFIAGIYGMNMPIPENDWPLMYPLFWVICLGISGGMLAWFRGRGWI